MLDDTFQDKPHHFVANRVSPEYAKCCMNVFSRPDGLRGGRLEDYTGVVSAAGRALALGDHAKARLRRAQAPRQGTGFGGRTSTCADERRRYV